MASTINASSSSGIIQTADTSAILQLQTAGTTALTVDTSANVGIGTTSPANVLNVKSATQYKGVQVNNATNTIAELIGFDASNESGGLKLYSSASPKVQLLSNGSSFLTGGNVGINTTSPTSLLTVQSGSILLRSEVTTGALNTYNLGFSATATGGAAAYVTSYRENANDASSLVFGNWNGSSSGERMRITSGGNVSIATSGAGITTSGSYALNLGTNGSVSQFSITTSGALAFGTPPNGTFAALSWYNANGQMYANTSSLRYKTNVETYTGGLETIKKLRPVTFKYINEGVTLEDEPVNAGFIAEEMDALGLKDFVIYKEINGQQVPDSLKYQNMCVLYVNAIQEMSILIEELKSINDTQAELISGQAATINALVTRIEALENRA